MIIIQCKQGSPEWHAARAGVITASNFALARAKLKSGPEKGKPTSAAKDYAFRLAVERISGKPLDGGFETWQMQRGRDLEADARREHEIKTGLLVDEVGFITTDDGIFGASADGLIDKHGGAEYKCFVSPEKLRAILTEGDIADVMDQVQGGMWISERKWWHFGLYCPELEPVEKQFTLLEVKRDDDFIFEMERDLLEFERLVRSYEMRLREKAA